MPDLTRLTADERAALLQEAIRAVTMPAGPQEQSEPDAQQPRDLTTEYMAAYRAAAGLARSGIPTVLPKAPVAPPSIEAVPDYATHLQKYLEQRAAMEASRDLGGGR